MVVTLVKFSISGLSDRVLLLNLIDFLYPHILHVSARSGKDPNGVRSFLVELKRQLPNKHKLR